MKKRSEVDVKETWKIEDMYEDDAAFYKELDELSKLADEFSKKYKNLETKEEVYESLDSFSEMMGLVSNLDTFAGITMETDATDQSMIKRYANLSNKLAEIFAKLSSMSQL